MKWNQIPLGPLETNCYVLSNDAKECIIIDPGEEGKKLIRHLEGKKLKPPAALLTHAHFDHICALDLIRDHYKIPAYLHRKEADWLGDAALNGSQAFLFGQRIELRPADEPLKGEGILEIGSFTFQVLETPGHSPGSVTYYLEPERMAFSGDVLFMQSVGRTDLAGGNESVLMNSIRTKLFPLPEDTIILPGHGPVTELRDEKASNPFLRGM